MSIRHNLFMSVVVLLVLVFIAAVRSVEVSKSWFNYADSAEASVSEAATQALARLPPNERSLKVAVDLCHEHSPSSSAASDEEYFCAWIAVNNSDGGRPVAVSCFNEWHRQCNRQSLTKTGFSSNKSQQEQMLPRQTRDRVTVNAGERSSKYRRAECELCSPCANGKWDACPTCSRVCYCTCAHTRYAANELTSSSRDIFNLRGGIFECHQFCDGQLDCDNRNDEGFDVCNYYKLGGSPTPERVQNDSTSFIISVIVLICFGAGFLYWKYATYYKALRLSQAPPAQPLVPVNLPAGSYPRQEPEAQLPPPPPPSYDDAVAK